MSNFNVYSIVDDLKLATSEAAKEVLRGMGKEATEDAFAFVEMALPAMARYSSLYITRQITEDEFNSLVLGLRDLAQMSALTLAGLAQIKIDETRNAILKTVSNIAIGAASKFI